MGQHRYGVAPRPPFAEIATNRPELERWLVFRSDLSSALHTDRTEPPNPTLERSIHPKPHNATRSPGVQGMGGGRVAFSARMFYWPNHNSWGDAHEVRLVWLVVTLAPRAMVRTCIVA
jgi:hypothetical protein